MDIFVLNCYEDMIIGYIYMQKVSSTVLFQSELFINCVVALYEVYFCNVTLFLKISFMVFSYIMNSPRKMTGILSHETNSILVRDSLFCFSGVYIEFSILYILSSILETCQTQHILN